MRPTEIKKLELTFFRKQNEKRNVSAVSTEKLVKQTKLTKPTIW